MMKRCGLKSAYKITYLPRHLHHPASYQHQPFPYFSTAVKREIKNLATKFLEHLMEIFTIMIFPGTVENEKRTIRNG